MLARIAHDVYWLGRHMARAEHTARMLDGLFHADLQGSPDDPASVTLSWDSLLAIMGSPRSEGEPARRDDVVNRLTLDAGSPVSILSCVAAAREGARTIRDTLPAEAWECVNTFHLGLAGRDLSDGLRTGPYSIYSYVKERTALFWGLTARTMQNDRARAFLEAGGRLEAADMVLRMLRAALPVRGGDDEGADAPRRDGNALALLQSIGGFHAFMRAVAAPPNAEPVARFLLYERDFPDSVAASVDALEAALVRADHDPPSSPPVLRLRRMTADLELRSRVTIEGAALTSLFRSVQQELDHVDTDVGERYFHGRGVGRQTVMA